MLTATLDETYRCAIAHLGPGESLIVTAPPAEAEITGQPDQPWVWLRYDDFGVRNRFGKNLFGTIGGLDRRTGLYTHAMGGGDAVHEGGVARIRGHLEGTKRKPAWVPDGFEVVEIAATDTGPRFWPPQRGDVWLGNLGERIPHPLVCGAGERLYVGGDGMPAERAWDSYGPLRLVWRDGAVVTAMHSSELAR